MSVSLCGFSLSEASCNEPLTFFVCAIWQINEVLISEYRHRYTTQITQKEPSHKKVHRQKCQF